MYFSSVLHRFVATVRHQDHPRKPAWLMSVRMVSTLLKSGGGEGDVTRKGPVIHGHMAVKRIYDDFGSLRQRDLHLVPVPFDVSE